MELTPLQAVRDLVEQQTTLGDPAERDRALRNIEEDLYDLLSVVATYRGDAQVQMGGDGQQAEQQPDSSEQQPKPNQ
jgi:hypothetical protein